MLRPLRPRRAQNRRVQQPENPLAVTYGTVSLLLAVTYGTVSLLLAVTYGTVSLLLHGVTISPRSSTLHVLRCTEVSQRLVASGLGRVKTILGLERSGLGAVVIHGHYPGSTMPALPPGAIGPP